MKRFIYIVFILCFTSTAFAGQYPINQTQQRYPQYQTQKIQSLPTGTFKKRKDGTIVQYNDKGKKIGTYKLSGNKLVSPKK
mgnify:FL=1